MKDFLLLLKIERYRTILKRKLIAWATAPFIFLLLLICVPFVAILHLLKAVFEFLVETKDVFKEIFVDDAISFGEPFNSWNNLKRGLPRNHSGFGIEDLEEQLEASNKMIEEFEHLKQQQKKGK